MKIAVVCPYRMDRRGGVQTHVRDSAAEMRRLGHQVVVIAPRGDTDEDGVATPARAVRIGFNRTRFDVSAAFGRDRERLRETLRRHDADIVHLHTPWTPFLPWQCLRATAAPAVATFHDTPPDTAAGHATRRLFRRLSAMLSRRVDTLIAVSPSPAAHLDAPVDRPVEVVPPCIDLGRFTAHAEPLRRFRDDHLNLLFLGRLDRRKDVGALLDAHARLRAEGLPVRTLIAGDGGERDALTSRVRRERIEAVVFLGDVAEHEKPALLATADVFCSPAREGESFGIVLVEAMASARAVVGAANAGYRSILSERAGDALARPGDADDLHRKLRILLTDEGARRSLAEWGEARAGRYDCRAVVPRLLEIYARAVGRRGGGSVTP